MGKELDRMATSKLLSSFLIVSPLGVVLIDRVESMYLATGGVTMVEADAFRTGGEVISSLDG